MRRFLFVFAGLCLVTTVSHANQPIQVTRVMPSGKGVKSTRQITLTFNQKMVPLGRMERTAQELGITIQPELKCQWKWLDPSNLSCELTEENAFRPATQYTLKLQPGLKSESGVRLASPFTHTFSTELPQASNPNFETWKGPGWPSIQLYFNQPVTRSSVEKVIAFAWTGGKTASKAELPEWGIETIQRRKNGAAVFTTENYKHKETPVDRGSDIAALRWIVSPTSELPADTTIRLEQQPGLESALGPMRGESQLLITFDTFPAFRFVGITCKDNDSAERKFVVSGTGTCSPLAGVTLEFSAPILKEQLREGFKVTPPLAAPGGDDEAWENVYVYSSLSSPHKRGDTYSVPLPRFLQARREYRFQISGIKDRFDRVLKTPVNFAFTTLPRPPNIKVPNSIAVLERDVASDVPVFITNLEKVVMNYSRLSPTGAKAGLTKEIVPAKVNDLAFAIPMETRSMIEGGSSVLVGGVQTVPPVPDRAISFFVQVTPFQAVAKLGHYNTAVWVTDMKSGQPVGDASVEIVQATYPGIAGSLVPVSSAKTDKAGYATLKGRAELDPALTLTETWSSDWYTTPRLMVKIVKGRDIAILPLDSNFKIEAYRLNSSVYPDAKPQWGHLRSWGTTAQGVYKAGDTIQYKIYVRNDSNERLEPAPKKNYTLIIKDPTGKEAFRRESISLNDFGSFDGDFKTAQNAPVGWYEFELTGDFGKFKHEPLRVLVSDFTVSPFKVESRLNGDLFQTGDVLTVDTAATMHAGGPYADAPVRVTGSISPLRFESKNPKTADFVFQNEPSGWHEDLFQVEAKVDKNGKHQHKMKLEKVPYLYGSIFVESAVSDDRGKRVSDASMAVFSGLNRRVGLKSTQWVFKKGESARVLYVVVDPRGEPQPGTSVQIKIEREDVTVAKVKGAGNAYLNEYTREWVAAGACQGVSEKDPSECRFVPDKPGSYRLIAEIKDTKGVAHSVSIYTYVVGPGPVLWSDGEEQGLPLIPEKQEYRIGEKARFLAKNPFPGATALVTIERNGVLKSWTTTLKDSTAMIEFPVEPDFMPGFYLSVVVVSPRVQIPEPLGDVDLGKPAFRMGLVEMEVRDPYKEITVTPVAEKDTYRPRDKVKVRIAARPRNRDPRSEPIELAVVVLDEAVLQLIQSGTRYYDPYKGFYSLTGLDVDTYSLLTNIVGRRKFEKKGANPGGSGGRTDEILARNLFKFVSYWNPSIRLSPKGESEIEFQVPDNLTGWRVLAMAVTPGDRMGLGQANFKVNKPTELRPVMPNQVTEGDKFRAGFSLLNRTAQARNLQVRIEAEGDTEKASTAAGPTVHEETVALKPHERKTVFIDLAAGRVKASRETEKGRLKIKATAKDSVDQDGIVHEIPVLKSRSLQTAAAYGTTDEAIAKESIEFPKDIQTDVGSVSVTAAPSVIGNVEGAFTYMRDYPYMCWEQKLTKATMASHFARMKAYLPGVVWNGADQLPQATLEQAANYQAPNGGMGFFQASDERVSPYLSAYTAVAFQWLRKAGHTVPQAVETKLQEYLLNLLRKKAVPTFYDEGMESTVRAVALHALAQAKKIDAAEVKRYFAHMPKMSLFGKAHYMLAAMATGGTDDEQAKTMQAILAQGNQTSGKFMFSEPWQTAWQRILGSPIRDNCAVLSSIVNYARTPRGKTMVADIPFRLIRSLTQSRGSRTHFENTQENIFCMQSLIDYAQEYEKTPPKFTVSAALNGKAFGEASFSNITDPLRSFERPLEASDPGTRANVTIERKGQGRLYYATRVSFAPKLDASRPQNAGIEVRREYHVERSGKWVLLGDSAEIKRGELVRVDLYVSLPAARNYVVVSDPVPGGLEPVNRDLGGSSTVDANKALFHPTSGSFFHSRKDWIEFGLSLWSFYHRELRHDSALFYADYLQPGNYRLSYTAQAIATGRFAAGPTHAEEMYDPDVFGKAKAASFVIAE